jgi:hypothetical protein
MNTPSTSRSRQLAPMHSVAVQIPNLKNSPRLMRFRGYHTMLKAVTGFNKASESFVDFVQKIHEFETEMELQRLVIMWRFHRGLPLKEIVDRLQFHPNPDFRRTFRQVREFCDQVKQALDQEESQYGQS